MAIKFNGKSLPNGVKVTEVSNSVLPPLSRSVLKVSGRAGAYDFGNEMDEREIEVSFVINSTSRADLKTKIRALGEWLYSEQPQELILLDEPNKYYLAKVTGSTDYDSVVNTGTLDATFVCSYPYAISTTTKSITHNEQVVNVVNNGSTDAFPTLEYTFTQNVPYFAIATDTETLEFGSPFSHESNTITNLTPLILWDEMSSTAPWTAGTTVSNGVVQGTFTSNGYQFSQTAGTFGTGSNWHGASAKRALSKPLQDFRMQALIGLASSTNDQSGKVEIYLLDANGNIVGRIAMKDAWADGKFNQAEAFAKGNQIVSKFATKKDAWAMFTNGILQLERSGNRWYAYFAMTDANGVHHTRMGESWIDTSNQTLTPVTQIQIHVAQLATRPVSTQMWVGDIKVWELLKKTAPTQLDYAFRTGDILIIDTERRLVTKNGQPCFDIMQPSSSFPKFKKGNNGLAIEPMSANGTISFKERWL